MNGKFIWYFRSMQNFGESKIYSYAWFCKKSSSWRHRCIYVVVLRNQAWILSTVTMLRFCSPSWMSAANLSWNCVSKISVRLRPAAPWTQPSRCSRRSCFIWLSVYSEWSSTICTHCSVISSSTFAFLRPPEDGQWCRFFDTDWLLLNKLFHAKIIKITKIFNSPISAL